MSLSYWESAQRRAERSAETSVWDGRCSLNTWEEEKTPGVSRLSITLMTSQHFLGTDYTSDRCTHIEPL